MLKQVTVALFFVLVLIVNGKITLKQVNSINGVLTTVAQLENQCTTSADCAAEPVGALACGGPSDYIVYSQKSSYVEYILSLAKLTKLVEHQYNQDSSIISICSLVEKPTVICAQNEICVAQ